MTASSKQVAIRTEANADELKLGLHDAVNQDKVGLDVAIAITGVVSRKSMVAQIWRKRLLRAEKINDSSYRINLRLLPELAFSSGHDVWGDRLAA